MRHAPPLRLAAAAALTLLAGAGCTHNHYYTMGNPVGGTGTICEPTAPPMVIQGASARPAPTVVAAPGAVCEVPARAATAPVLASGEVCPPGTVAVNRSAPPSAVVVSEKSGRRGLFGWRSRNEDAVLSTQISGAYDGEVVR